LGSSGEGQKVSLWERNSKTLLLVSQSRLLENSNGGGN
jgi:hypothetical protein